MENKMFQNIDEFEKEFIGEESSNGNEDSVSLKNDEQNYVAPICVHFVTNNLLIH